MEHIIMPITINKETRDIKFSVTDENRFSNNTDFAGRIGNGMKTHRLFVSAYKNATTGEIKLVGYALNRTASITSFRDTVSDHAKSQHNGSKIKKVGK